MSAKTAPIQPLRQKQIDAPTSFLEDYLPYLLGHASYEMNKHFDQYVRAAGLSPLEWRTLATLADGGGLTIGELCHKVVAQQPTLTKTIKRLHEAGLARREDDDQDLRKTRVFSTSAGRAIAQELMKTAKAHEADLLRNLGLDQIRTLKAALRGIFARKAPGVPADPGRAAMKAAQR